MQKKTIGMETIKEVFKNFEQVLRGDISYEKAVTKLYSSGMNYASARMYLTCICALFNGDYFGRTVNGKAIEYFLNMIYEKYGSDKLINALGSLEKHLDAQANNLVGQRMLYEYYSELVGRKMGI